jgi:nucleotide-binding universal stress UspA family protein
MKASHILVPTDFSDASIEAVKMAAKFVEFYDSTVDLIHVIPLMSYYDESMQHLGVPFDMEKDLYPKVLKTANEKMHEIAEKYIPKEHCGQLLNLVGRKPSDVIAGKANENHYDLVIMSNKGSHDTDEVRSHATQKVIRQSEKPVLSISKPFNERNVNEILVPVDGSDDSTSALTAAFDFAILFDAQITLMHIIEPYSLGMEVMPLSVEDDEAVYQSLIKNIGKYFEKNPELGFKIKQTDVEYEDMLIHQEGAEIQSVKLISIVKKGFSAHTEICDYANAGADLVVMSTHGRTGIARILLGSTTGIVAQHLEIPLLTVRPM